MPSAPPIKIPILGVDMASKDFDKMILNANKMGAAISSLGKQMTAAITLPILGVGVASLKMSDQFNEAMSDVGTLIPGQRALLDDLKQDVLSLGVNMATPFEDVAKGLYDTVSAFGNAETATGKLNTVVKAAKAGGSTAAEALALLSAVTKGYGDTSNEAVAEVGDLAFLTVKLGQTTFPELASSIGKVVPLAKKLGEQTSSLFGYFATLTGVTGNAAEVSTQLASAYGAFLKPSTEMKKEVKKLGFASSIAMVQELGLIGALHKLNEAVEGDEQAMASMLTRKEGMLAAFALTGAQAGEAADKIKQMENATGSLDAAFKEKTNGINEAGFAFRQASQEVKRFMIQIGDRLAPVLLQLSDNFKPISDALNKMSDETLKTTIKIAGFMALAGPLVMVIGSITKSVILLTAVLGAGKIGAIFAVITGPIGAAVLALVGLTAAVALFWDQLKPLRDAVMQPFADILSDIVDLFSSGTDGASSLFGVLKDLVSVVASILAPFVKLGLYLYLLPFKGIVKVVHLFVNVLRLVSKVLKVAINAVKLGWAWLRKLWVEFTTGTEIGATLKKVFEKLGDAIVWLVDKISNAWNATKDFFGGILDFLDSAADKLQQETDRQNQWADVLSGKTFGGDEALAIDEMIASEIDVSREMDINLSFDGLPEGVSVRTETTVNKGGVKKKKKRGVIMGEGE